MMRSRRYTILSIATLLSVVATATTPVRAKAPFQSLKFDQVLARAAKEQKLIFVDFFATWCVPCKMLEQTTFKDDKVRAWLGGKSIAVQYDAEREVDLAEKFRIEFYPTLLFLKPDGTEIERYSGYLDAAEFMKLATAAAKGESVLGHLRAELKASPNDLSLKAQLADALMMRGQAVEAYDLLVSCLEDKKSPSLAFASQVAGMLVQVGRSDDDLHQKLVARRDRIEKALAGGEGADGKGTGGKAAGGEVGGEVGGGVLDAELALYVAVNAQMDERSRTLATFDRVKAKKETATLAQRLVPFVLDELVAAKRYKDVADNVDLNAKIEAAFAEAAQMPSDDGQPPVIQQRMRMMLVYQLADVYQTLVGLGRVDDARSLAKRILVHDSSSQTYNTLAWAGYLTGKPLEDNLVQAQQAWKLDTDKSVNVLDTLVRIMHARGQTAEAIKMCEAALKRAESDRDKSLINVCLEEFRGDKTN